MIIADFSKTFTQSSMPTTWSVFAKSKILGDYYTHDRDALFHKYKPLEDAQNIEETKVWFLEHARLFVKYGLTNHQIDELVMDDAYFAPRKGAHEFISYLDENNIPLTVVTSGLSIVVSKWFQLRYGYIPHSIIGNELIFQNGKAVGVNERTIICSLDKSNTMQDFPHAVVIGDNIEDIGMHTNPIKSIGFTDAQNIFDISLGSQGSMADIIPHIDDIDFGTKLSRDNLGEDRLNSLYQKMTLLVRKNGLCY